MRKPLLQRMLEGLPFSAEELNVLVKTAPFRYKVYQIPKRRANEFRTIAQPPPEIKVLQRWLIENVLVKLPVHRSATAYREGVSIGKHASIHAGRRFLLKMDFKDFFPSISSEDVEEHLREFGHYSYDEARLVSRLACWRDRVNHRLCLSVGAPSSPMLSNAILLEFDRRISKIARQRAVVYSRYADDLAFSTNRKGVLADIAGEVTNLCTELPYPRLTINEAKTVLTSRRWKRVLVGLVLTPEGGVSLGRDRKRRLRSELYRFSRGQLENEKVSKLRGELAFAWSVEPSFVRSLVRRLGPAVFGALELPFGDK